MICKFYINVRNFSFVADRYCFANASEYLCVWKWYKIKEIRLEESFFIDTKSPLAIVLGNWIVNSGQLVTAVAIDSMLVTGNSFLGLSTELSSNRHRLIENVVGHSGTKSYDLIIPNSPRLDISIDLLNCTLFYQLQNFIKHFSNEDPSRWLSRILQVSKEITSEKNRKCSFNLNCKFNQRQIIKFIESSETYSRTCPLHLFSKVGWAFTEDSA